MYRYLPTVLMLPHVSVRNPRLDASVVIKLSMALAHKWLEGPATGVWRTWMGLIEIEFRLSSHEFSI